MSDQADFNQLLRFVEEARPKIVLTFRGASKIFAEIVSRKLGITARELAANIAPPQRSRIKLDDKRIVKCQDDILKLIEIPDYTYERRDLVALGIKEGFSTSEIEEALLRLVKGDFLNYSGLVDGYKLRESKRNSRQL